MNDNQKLEKLIELRKKIPSMTCLHYCSACCAHTPWSRFEWYLMPESIRLTHNFFSIGCDFCRFTRCRVYKYRPITCRLFGVVDDDRLRCPKGVLPPEMLSSEQAGDIMRQYDEIFFRHGG